MWQWWQWWHINTQGGIHIYHLLSTYIASWPTLLFSLLTVTLSHTHIHHLCQMPISVSHIIFPWPKTYKCTEVVILYLCHFHSYPPEKGDSDPGLPRSRFPDAGPERHEQVPPLPLGPGPPLRYLLFPSPNCAHGGWLVKVTCHKSQCIILVYHL